MEPTPVKIRRKPKNTCPLYGFVRYRIIRQMIHDGFTQSEVAKIFGYTDRSIISHYLTTYHNSGLNLNSDITIMKLRIS